MQDFYIFFKRLRYIFLDRINTFHVKSYTMDSKETSITCTNLHLARLYRWIGTAFVTLVMFILIVPSVALTADWEDEFEDICSRVSAADSYSIEELQTLIKRSDELAEKIKASDNRRKKIFIRRLKRCRKFFEFSIEVKQGETTQ
jgi:hypothetical protein